MMEQIRQSFKRALRRVAVVLDRVSKGKITPNAVTITGMLMHVPIAWLITQHTHAAYLWAAVLLIVFGLFDTLDGQLAQAQKRESARGMMLDAMTDRVKEVLLYVGTAFALIQTGGSPQIAAWAVAACGFSLLPGYINALGEATIAKYGGHGGKERAINKTFRDGLFPFEIRVTVLIVGLLANQLAAAVIVIAIGAAYTALSRLMKVYGKLAS